MSCHFIIIGWAIAGIDYFNTILKDLTKEQELVAGDEPNGYSGFEKECMEEWKLEYDLKNDRTRGKKRHLTELSRSTNFELEELSKAFNLAPV